MSAIWTKTISVAALRSGRIHAGRTSPPAEISVSRRSRKQDKKQTLRKEIRDVLTSILSSALDQDVDPRETERVNKAESMIECVNVHGLLKNPMTKRMDLIFAARNEYFNNGNLTFYYVDDENLFKTFPAAGIYHGPYTGSKEIFVEVMAYIDGMYVCKPIDNIRYAELMSIHKENK